MKFIYQYRTSDNVRHEGAICAPSREDAFSALHEQGIRPSRLDEAPGFLNKLLGLGKRWMAIVVLACVAIAALALAERRGRLVEEARDATQSPMLRHFIYGDVALMDKLYGEDFASVFTLPGDRILARYAQPGVCLRQGAPVSVPSFALDAEMPTFVFSPQDSREVVELKRIVLWMREELRTYLEKGTGTEALYLKRLEERQQREAQIRNLARVELANEKDMGKWEVRNNGLRALGIETIPLPESADVH